MSPQACTICEHPEHSAIDAALAGDEPGRSVARRFELTEAAVRRHKANHLPPRAGSSAMLINVDTGNVTKPDVEAVGRAAGEDEKMPESAEAIARQRYEQEESRRREERIATLEREEKDRRVREAAEREREEALAAARAEAEELARRRAELEDVAEEELGRLLRVLGELEALDRRHTSLLGRHGLLRAGQLPLRNLVASWLQMRLGDFAPGGTIRDPYGGAPLKERDNLAKVKG